jgi:hypothetical protein
MKNINASIDLRRQALGAIDKYLAFQPVSGTVGIMEAVLGLLPGCVTEWQSSAIFARDRLQRVHDQVLAGTVEGIYSEDLNLLNKIIQFYEEVHYEPRRQAEMEKAILEVFTTAYDDEELAGMIELYELRSKAVALETQLTVRRNSSTKKAA